MHFKGQKAEVILLFYVMASSALDFWAYGTTKSVSVVIELLLGVQCCNEGQVRDNKKLSVTS